MSQAPQRKRTPAKAGAHSSRSEWGGTVIGFIAGVVVGLVAALGVAIYVTKVPVPFMNGKTQSSRAADDDAAETKRNQNWDPNSPLHSRNPVRPAAPPTAAAPAPTPSQAPVPAAAPPVVNAPVARPAPSDDPLGDLARARAGNKPAPAAVAAAPATPAADPFDYFVQAGAFRTPEDAEAQRVRLAMLGLDARVTEREQAGRTVYRVRMGPFRTREDAERTKTRLDDTGADAALVRVQR